jgi:minichromosome maintenance protein 10
MGREGQAKAKRKFGQDADRELQALLERDKEGMKAVVRAREVGKILDEKNGKREKRRGKDVKKRDKVMGRREWDDSGPDSSSDLALEDPTMAVAQKNAYSAQIIKQLGFDPTMKPGQKRADDAVVKKKVHILLHPVGTLLITCCIKVGSLNSCSVVSERYRTRPKTRTANTI